MEQYIKKSALVAEIEKRAIEAGLHDGVIAETREDECYSILSIINTLEVKEVDLNEYINKYFKGWYVDLTDQGNILHTPDGNAGLMSVKEVAKHFFELGLQAQHDNWKVVDNTNPPQADRNKIYCVFTKQQYILAKVINHPQDGELLQWKCTEFPHHRYDMCEGDKYMQII